ncbi:hypothetical protein [Parvularcula marina]|uniref:Uncharacterized protein n=1 Tax=Parvularcula marina TaxID=2292771 RepID=A0A371REU3_9PROT|nr:hypothetical protein [Parvularcula marina]RFB03962.1 hypothetical protein DX908_00875 [Parvularcula marina]
MLQSLTISAFALVSAALQPVPAGPDDGPEAIAAQYFAPPSSTKVDRVVTTERLERAGPITLARSIGKVEEALTQCQALRLQMEALIGDNYGSYSVHPGWVDGYKDCLETRFDEIQQVKVAIDRRQQALLSGQNADSAVRAADAMARLSVYQLDVRKAVEAEVSEQKKFIAYYNTGNKPQAADAQ